VSGHYSRKLLQDIFRAAGESEDSGIEDTRLEGEAGFSCGDLRLSLSVAAASRRRGNDPVSGDEAKALRALTAYAAHRHNMSEATVREILRSCFGTKTHESLPARLYQNAVEFLADLQVKELIN